MVSFKGILKYIIIVFIAVWMFVLGIMVGRGNSPVTFDTRGFENRLGQIVRKLRDKEDEQKEVDLEFFKVLDQPVPEERNLPGVLPLKTGSKFEDLSVPLDIPIKMSTKKRTFQKKMRPVKLSEALPASTVSVQKTRASYTIQIAAYNNFKDAVTRMADLEKMGIASYRETSQKDGITWYRVRTGAFFSFEEAKKARDKLNRIKIKAMIIKKENDEDIKG